MWEEWERNENFIIGYLSKKRYSSKLNVIINFWRYEDLPGYITSKMTKHRVCCSFRLGYLRILTQYNNSAFWTSKYFKNVEFGIWVNNLSACAIYYLRYFILQLKLVSLYDNKYIHLIKTHYQGAISKIYTEVPTT